MCDQPGKNPLKYSAVAGNWTQATERADSELSHWAIMAEVWVKCAIPVYFVCQNYCLLPFRESLCLTVGILSQILACKSSLTDSSLEIQNRWQSKVIDSCRPTVIMKWFLFFHGGCQGFAEIGLLSLWLRISQGTSLRDFPPAPAYPIERR